jgi:hypothetical protein
VVFFFLFLFCVINLCVSTNTSVVALTHIASFRWRSELQKHSAAEHGLKILEMKTCSLCHKEIVARRLNEHVKQAVLGIRDPHVFGPPGSGSGSGSINQRYGSGSFYHQAIIVRKTLIPAVL